MQRSERDEAFDRIEQAVVYQHRFGEEVAAVYDPVTDRRQGVAVDRRAAAVEGAEG